MSHYRIERLLGVGGLGMVYEARWLLPYGESVRVACKVMRDDRRHIPHYHEFIRQEAATSIRLGHNHPNLVTAFNLFEDSAGRPCLVMELVQGGSVADLLDAYHRLPFSVVRRIAVKALSALACLHGAEVLHRDLSPCNILVSTAGDVKVSDLNLVKPMDDGKAYTQTFRGKPVYASPEALERGPLDARSDLYSLGVILYETLAGKPPWGDERDPDRILACSKREGFPPLPASTPRDLVELITGLLRSQSDARKPQSAQEGLAFLQHSGEPIADRGELSRLVTTTVMKQRKAERRARGIVQDQPLEILKPGDMLVARPVDVPESAGHAMNPDDRPERESSSSATTEEYLEPLERKPPRRGTQSMASMASLLGGSSSKRSRGGRTMRFAAFLLAFTIAGATVAVLFHTWRSAGDGLARTQPTGTQRETAAPVQLAPPGETAAQEQRIADVPVPIPLRAREAAKREHPAPMERSRRRTIHRRADPQDHIAPRFEPPRSR